MITNDDVTLSKLSYTDTDFPELYPDLLDLAKKLTNKWDPSLSNESDPGVVLLKHAAFVGDHNNYNTDKNTLEAFLPTATQDVSVRNIVEMNGYTPRYYISASGRLTFTYKGDYTGSFTIPAFNIVVSNEDGSIAYTQVEDLQFSGQNIEASALFIEGTLQTLAINNESKITMENIDSDYRVYFPDAYVAQNGVFIRNVGAEVYDFWERDNYLLTNPKGSKKYKIDFDSSKGLSFIEFPNDIANLIGDGLIIKYLSTSGLAGNITARSLNTIQSPDSYKLNQVDSISMSDIEVRNNSSITNGKDPETINEMYSSFKKVVGTFETLVTCLDYTNALYMVTDQLNNNLVGNDIITDIRTDYNKAGNFVTYDNYGVWYKNVSIGKAILSAYNFNYVDTSVSEYTPEPGDVKVENGGLQYYTFDGAWEDLNDLTEIDFTQYINGLSPYDLVVHALKPFSMSEYSYLNPYKALSNSFQKPTDDSIKSAVSQIEELKCINHNFKYPDQDGEVYIFKNYAPLKCMITPYNKLSKFEKAEIQDNIYRVLSEKYNSHEVDFGEPINEEILQNDILNADERIRSVDLKPIEYIPTAAKLNLQNTDNPKFDEISLESDTELTTDLVAKNFLAGRIKLFDFDDTFEWGYGQQLVESEGGQSAIPMEIDSIENITTELDINDSIGTAASEQEEKEYTSYDDYNVVLEPNNNYVFKDGEIITIAGQDYQNDGNDILVIKNVGTNNVLLDAALHDGKIATYRIDSSGKFSGDGNVFEYTLKDNEYFIAKNKNYTPTKVYPENVTYQFLTNNNEEKTIKANSFYKLEDGENLIFIYTNTKDVIQKETYTTGTVIKSTFDIKDLNHSGLFKQTTIDPTTSQNVECNSVPSGQRISICEPLTTIVDTNDVKCYWIRNNSGNILFNTGEVQVDLDQGEYFILATKSESQMIIYGSGTRIERNTDNGQWACNKLNISSITSSGFNADIDWQQKNFANNNLSISEFSITVLGPNDSFSLDSVPGDISLGDIFDITISNSWLKYKGDINYTLSGESGTLTSNSDPYYIRTRLDISSSPDKPQILQNTIPDTVGAGSTSSQKIIINDGISSVVDPIVIEGGTANNPVYFQTNENLNIIGGTKLDISDYGDISLYNYKVEEPEYRIGKYAETDITGTPTWGEWRSAEKSSNGYRLELNNDALEAKFPLYYQDTQSVENESTRQFILPIYLSSSAENLDDITISVEDNNLIEIPNNEFRLDMSESEPIIVDGIDIQSQSLPTTAGIYYFNIFGVTSDQEEIAIKNYAVEITEEDVGHGQLYIDVSDYNLIDVTSINYDQFAWKISEFNSEVQDTAVINKPEMYLLTISRVGGPTLDPDSPSISIQANLTVTITYMGKENKSGTLFVLYPKVIKGINGNLSAYTDLNSVLNRIKYLVQHSSEPNIKIYYINEPENELAIENDNIINLWDKNNVANSITIAQIDFASDDSYIEVVKSMMKG